MSGGVDRAAATERKIGVRFPVGPKQRLKKLVFTASLLDVQHQKAQCEAYSVCVVDKWAGGSLTRRLQGPFVVFWPRQRDE